MEIDRVLNEEKDLSEKYKKLYGSDQEVVMQQWVYAKKRLEELKHLSDSPFFAKVVYEDEEGKKESYISKYSYASDGVISWTVPVSTLRFEELGECEISLPKDKIKKVNLNQKDNYVLSNEKVIYYSQEDVVNGVNIIYEDFLNSVKGEYGLSEIVSKIEKEQYKIIQSNAKVPLIISGPAGSGKTTICLHRVAYLLQTPETSGMYTNGNMIMFAQDKSTKEYFSSILPKLGIPNMTVTTFFEWCTSLMKLENILEINLANIDENYLNYLEEKINVLEKSKITFKKYGDSFETGLGKLYKKSLKEESYKMFTRNQKDRKYDYLDMTIMLNMMKIEGGLYIEDEYHKMLGEGKYKAYKRKTKIDYKMIIVDEFQNYSYDQISLIRKCVSPINKSIVYVGDVNQKSLLKPETKNENDHFVLCKKVDLDKVYRNTKEILEFLKEENYKVEIPETAKSGPKPEKYNLASELELSQKIKDVVSDKKAEETIGILCDKEVTKNKLKVLFPESEKLKIMTKLESQGTEFNSVICINESRDYTNSSERFVKIMNNLNRNSDYIGYTRSTESLFVYVVNIT